MLVPIKPVPIHPIVGFSGAGGADDSTIEPVCRALLSVGERTVEWPLLIRRPTPFFMLAAATTRGVV
jgi:hypothetical protein